MKAKLHFFMTAKDMEQFLLFATPHVDEVQEKSLLKIGDCQIDFMPSKLVSNTLLAGSLYINSGGLTEGCKDQDRANKTYRTLRNKIKKDGFNRLSTWLIDHKNNMTRERNYWLASDAKRWKQANPNRLLKISENGSHLFDIAPEFSEMGEIKPKNTRFKFRGA